MSPQLSSPSYSTYITKCSKVASITFSKFQLLEMLDTLPDEVALVWSAKFSTMKVIFLINKYSPLVDTLLGICLDLVATDPKWCNIEFQVLAYCYIVGVVISECILIARTMALWEFNRLVGVLLLGAGTELLLFALYSAQQTITHVTYPSPEVSRLYGCAPGGQDRDVWPAYMCMLLAETGIIVLTLKKRWLDPVVDTPKSGELFRTMYRDGTFFYLIVFFVSLLNLVVMISTSDGLVSSLQMPLRAAMLSSKRQLDDFSRNTALAFENIDLPTLQESTSISARTTCRRLDITHASYFYANKCTRVASITFWLLEVLDTLPDEVALVWSAKFSIMKVIYFVNKYALVIDTTLGITVNFAITDTVACHAQFQALFYCYNVGILFSEMILMARTMALWEFNKLVVYFLVGASVELVGFSIYASQQLVNHVIWFIGLTLMKRWLQPVDDHPKAGALFRTIYRDGTFFYIIIFFASMLNLLVIILAPGQLVFTIQMPLRVIHSALCSRVLLNLRKAAALSSRASLHDFSRITAIALENVDLPTLQEIGLDQCSHELQETGYYA
ncbi:uncharacterized protein BXZ73DRAFT_105112 [Epithele typhae]|uniref:uncharacterized protein n=1 Tax=Epithele typhae TaxID=378194 RepID=UPI002007D59A|nr:uncharacterized protein BXZ73DRAFT_105112 [Epithele typhae]KAH9918714.1 hypothetical protein BXZ73DRAFT_105112 [Epithele typhae]